MTLGQADVLEELYFQPEPEDLISLESAEDVARYGAAPVSQVWFEEQERQRLRRAWWPLALIATAGGYLFWTWRQTA